MTSENAIREKSKELVRQFMASYEPDTFLKNEHGTYFYYSKNGVSGINLQCFFEDLAEHVLWDLESQKEMNKNLLESSQFVSGKLSESVKENQELKAELTKTKIELELQENYNDMLVKELHERDKELNEIKESRKKDVERAYIDGYEQGDGSAYHDGKINRVRIHAEQYYKQKFELNDKK